MPFVSISRRFPNFLGGGVLLLFEKNERKKNSDGPLTYKMHGPLFEIKFSVTYLFHYKSNDSIVRSET